MESLDNEGKEVFGFLYEFIKTNKLNKKNNFWVYTFDYSYPQAVNMVKNISKYYDKKKRKKTGIYKKIINYKPKIKSENKDNINKNNIKNLNNNNKELNMKKMKKAISINKLNIYNRKRSLNKCIKNNTINNKNISSIKEIKRKKSNNKNLNNNVKNSLNNKLLNGRKI